MGGSGKKEHIHYRPLKQIASPSNPAKETLSLSASSSTSSLQGLLLRESCNDSSSPEGIEDSDDEGCKKYAPCEEEVLDSGGGEERSRRKHTPQSTMPTVTLSNPGLLSWVARQVPLVLLFGSLAFLVATAIWAQSVFAGAFLVLSVHTLCWMWQIAFFGLVGLLVKVPTWRRRAWDKAAESERLQHVQHYIVIPNYKEDLEVIDGTVRAVAQSCLARSSIRVVLAMEARDPGAQDLADQLCEKWRESFLEVFATFHPPGREGEIAGKSSNVSWAFQEVSKRARTLALDPALTAVHVNDADCLWHPDYFTAVALEIFDTPLEERQWLVWQAPQFHLRNHFDVPVMTKITGYSSAMYELGSLACPWGAHMCYSSYTMTLSLADRVDGWDADVIAEDQHMFCKCYFGSINHDGPRAQQPRVRLKPIFLPVKSFLVESAKGSSTVCDYCASVRARFVQARRHMQGITEFSYVILQWMETVRHHGLLRVPMSVHLGSLRILWHMLCVHNLPYCHITSVILANLVYARRFFGSDVLHNQPTIFNFFRRMPTGACAPLQSSAWEYISCLVFMWAPYAFALPAGLHILGAVLVIADFTRLTLLPSMAARAVGGEERGGEPACSCVRWMPVIFVQTALEVVLLSWMVIIAFGFVPEILAVWHLARDTKTFKYVCAEKPVSCQRNGKPVAESVEL